MRTVLLPVKDFHHAKQRLAGLLSAGQRAALARSMLADVLRAIAAARRPQRVVIFTASEDVAGMVRPFAFDVVRETAVAGHSAAVNKMVNELGGGASHLLSLAGDLPAMAADEIDLLFDSAAAAVNLVASRDGTGTNAVLLIAPARIRMEYGEGSLRRHLANAAAAGLESAVMHFPGIEFDIDTPEDLRLFMESARSDSEAWKYIHASAIDLR